MNLKRGLFGVAGDVRLLGSPCWLSKSEELRAGRRRAAATPSGTSPWPRISSVARRRRSPTCFA